MGVLKAKVGGSWENVLGGAGIEEVYVGPDDPGATYELWYDTDAPDVYTPWIAVTFQNGWGNVGGVDQVCQYRKINDIVYLRGTMFKTAVPYSSAAFTLPVGYRVPAYLRPHPMVLSNAGTQTLARADVKPTGEYVPVTGPADVGWWSIDFWFSVTA